MRNKDKNKVLSYGKAGFTLVELLVVISIIALLLSILMPSLNKAREQAKRVQCSSQLHQQGLALAMYAIDNNDRLPPTVYSNVRWIWDISYATTDVILASGGDKHLFYCPSRRESNADRDDCWRFSEYGRGVPMSVPEPTDLLRRQQEWRKTDYVYMMDSNDGRAGDMWIKKTTVKRASDRELVVDGTFSYLGLFVSRNVNHARGADKVTGTNILYVDSHVGWRDFNKMETHYPFAGGWNAWW